MIQSRLKSFLDHSNLLCYREDVTKQQKGPKNAELGIYASILHSMINEEYLENLIYQKYLNQDRSVLKVVDLEQNTTSVVPNREGKS